MSGRMMLGVLLAGMLPATVVAQDAPRADDGRLSQVITFRVQPSDAPAFRTMMSKVVEAAGQANLSADFGWSFWNDMFDYTLVFPVPNMAYFDDEGQWMRQFEGTPGQATLMQALGDMDSMEYNVTANEVVQSVNDWTYTPSAGAAPPGFAHVDRIWVKAGQANEQTFGELAMKVVTVLADIEFPYQMIGNRVRLGASGRFVFVTMYDTKEAYYGKNSLEHLAAQKGAQQRVDALFEELVQIVTAWEHSDMALVPDMTYAPRQQTTSQDGQ